MSASQFHRSLDRLGSTATEWWMPARTRRVLSAAILGAAGGGVTLVLSVIATTLFSPQVALGPLDVLPHTVVFIVGAAHGAAIGLAAGLGWRLFALVVGPFVFSWVPIAALLNATAIGAHHFISLAVYLVAGAITRAWVLLNSITSANIDSTDARPALLAEHEGSWQ